MAFLIGGFSPSSQGSDALVSSITGRGVHGSQKANREDRAGIPQTPLRTHSSNLISSHEAPSMILEKNKAGALATRSLKCPFCSQGSWAVKGTMADGLKPECPVEVKLS